MRFRWAVCCAWAVLCPSLKGASPDTYDIVVVSGSSGGVSAAVAAGRMGARVALIEDTPVLGGMLSNGISNIDTYSYESLSGIFEEFRAKVREHYQPAVATDPIFRGAAAGRPPEYRGRQSNAPIEGGRWEPHVADRIFKRMAAAVPSLTVFYNTWATGVEMRGRRVVGVLTENKAGEKRLISGKVIIDATHEADVAAWAGAPYRVGREARSPSEPHAGDIYFFNGTGEIMAGGTGRQDAAVVSYGLRLCVKHYPAGSGTSHLLSTPPPGYDRAEYVHASNLDPPSMPGGKTEMNKNPIGNEMQEVNWKWPDATRAERLKLYEEYKNHALGYLYFLQHERGMKHVGLPADEFTDNGNVPYRVFVREARRIQGEVTMTEADINPFITGRGLIPAARKDSVAIGHYAIDSKPVLRKTDMTTPEKGAGDFFLTKTTTPFQVPYGAIVPRNVEGLLVPVAMSATHVAFSAIRMDPTWMAMGQAAGVAAVLSIKEGVDPRHVPVEKLQRELIRQKARLVFYWDVPLDHPGFGAIQWLSVHKGLQGYPDRLFRPDQPVTRAEVAALAVRAFDLWPSVSNFHFSDVPWQHWAFREIEILFDNRLLVPFGVKPRWPEAGGYNPVRHDGFAQGQDFGNFEPGRTVTWAELVDLLRLIQARRVADPAAWVAETARASELAAPLARADISLQAPVSRAEACMLVAGTADF